MDTIPQRLVRVLLVAMLAVATATVSGRSPSHAERAPSPSAHIVQEDTDPVLYWNGVLQEAFRRQAKGAPGPLARAGAMMHTAIFDALMSIEKIANPYGQPPFQPYLRTVAADPAAAVGSAREWAIGYAARDTLTSVFAAQAGYFDSALTARLAGFSAGTPPESQAAAASVGQGVAQLIMEARADDGSGDPAAYTFEQTPGAWQLSESSNCDAPSDAVTPGWGRVQPFGVPTLEPFLRRFPQGFTSYQEALSSPAYAAAFKDVKEKGAREGSTRVGDEEEVAFFWANDLDGTYKPPGQLFEHTRIVSRDQSLGLVANARLFALVGLSMADAAIAAWDRKYLTAIDLWRPQTAIRLAGTDGNPDTEADSAWEPLSRDRNGDPLSPCFPAWVSGHATFGGAWAGAMFGFFGGRDIPFTATTEDPAARRADGTFPTRRFATFGQAAEENARSRVYLGVHFEWDDNDGGIIGDQIAKDIVATRLRPSAASDGRTDIGTAYNYSDQAEGVALHTWRSNGSGLDYPRVRWQGQECRPADPSAGLSPGSQFVSGDFNADFRTDVACFRINDDHSMHLLVWIATPSGFQAPQVVWSSANWGEAGRTQALAGDFNGDGRTDLAAAYNYHDGDRNVALWVWRATASGFEYPKRKYFGQVCRVPDITRPLSDNSRFVIGDFNADRRSDVACFHVQDSRAAQLVTWASVPGDGLDGFKLEAPQVRWTGPTWGSPYRTQVFSGDFNGDGRLDFAAAYNSQDATQNVRMLTWRSLGQQGFANPQIQWEGPQCKAPAVDRPLSVNSGFVSGDFNGDGFSDVACFHISDSRSAQLITWQVTRAGFGAPQSIWTGPTWGAPLRTQVYSGDFNN
ncbi:FG-GAP-like repeat-containing protein [Spongiactinospora sp. 9N601]|uniref:FG-GAP-like repeat-containing protein n=1 Tax=Spongiactinospora sp. 9N601 TaxID=3375149 RepID=UPI00378964CD